PRSLIRRKKQAPQPLAEIAPIIFAHGLVADAGGDLADARFERGAPLGGCEAAGLRLARPQHVRKRAPPPAHPPHRLPPAPGPAPAGVAGPEGSAASIASRPPERQRSSGSCPSGRLANSRLLPGRTSGSARSIAR